MGDIYINNSGNNSSSKNGGCLAAILSFFIPGLGQLLQGRLGTAIGHFLVCCVLWAIALGWVVNFYSAYDAAKNG